MIDLPHIITFNQIGRPDWGFISVAQGGKIPFEIKRVFWTYGTPEGITRGRHAHYISQQILIAVTGSIDVITETATGEINTFVLDSAQQGLYIPPRIWHTMQYSANAVQLTVVSTGYNEEDYIREYEQFKRL